MSRSHRAVLAGLLVVTVAACGGDDDDSATDAATDGDADRTIEIEMVDIAFEPSEVEVEAGETVRFVFTNSGEIPHEAFIGDDDEQAHHAEDMAAAHGDHGDTTGITVEPGERGEITHTFGDEVGKVLIGCHQPGHYEGGMVATIDVG